MTPAAVGIRCPEPSGKAQGGPRVIQAASRAATGLGSRRMNAVTMALIGINVLVYAAELAAGGNVNGTGNWIYEHGVLIANASYGDGTPAGVNQGEWWRLIT